MDALFREIKYASRMLLKNPNSSVVAVIAMALGIGLTASMFGIINGAVLSELPFDEADRLMWVEANNLSADDDSLDVSEHDFEDWRAQQQSFEGLAAFTSGTFNLADDGVPERYDGCWISTNYLDLLRAEPVHGRGFTAADGEVGAPPVLLLSYHVWQQRYGGSEDVIGQVVKVNSEQATIIGVIGEGIRFPVLHELWMPLRSETSESQRDEGRDLDLFGRLRDGVTIDAAVADLNTIARRLAEQYPETNEGLGAVVGPYTAEFADEQTRLLLGVMFVAVVLVLLIACFNVANLLIGRAAVRGRELAIRAALGSGRSRAISQVLVEAGLIAMVGASLGIVLTHFALIAFNSAIAQTDPPFWMHFGLDLKVLLFAVAAAFGATMVAGLVPALQASRADLTGVLQDASRGSTSFQLGRVSRLLVIAEVAISFALLTGAALTVRSVMAANNYDLRFESDHLLTARLGLFEGDYPEEQDWAVFFEQLRERVGGKAEVASAAVGTVIPTDTAIGAGGTSYERPGESYERPRDMPWARFTVVGPGYFETLGVPLLAGRDFDATDRETTVRVAIVNEDFARKEWPGENAIGQRIDLFQGEEKEAESAQAGVVEVIGVVPNLRFADFDNEDDQQGIYLPMAQNPVRFAWIIAKTRSDPVAFASPLRRLVLELDPNLPLYYVRSMDQVLAQTMFMPNLLWVLFSIFGVVAVILTSLGLYGVVAFGVSQRTQEIGVRMAFGARTFDILRMVLRQGLTKVAIGLVLGLLLAVPMALLLKSVLFQVNPADPVTFAVIPVLLALVAVIACLIPALKASSVDPLTALHYE